MKIRLTSLGTGLTECRHTQNTTFVPTKVDPMLSNIENRVERRADVITVTLHARYTLDIFLSKNPSLSGLFDLKYQADINGIFIGLLGSFERVERAHSTT